MSVKIRLDKYLSEQNISDSREKAKREIIAGWVKVNGETVRNPSYIISGDEAITVQRPKGVYVSRGGEKLAQALQEFLLDVSGKIIVDLGASTGGFTDCLLKNGARKVYAIDVGYGQLDYRLRQDHRVIVRERTNARLLKKEDFSEHIDFITADLSFISIIKIVAMLKQVFAPIEGVILLKPQFEADKSEHKKGVVTKKEHHYAIVARVLSSLVAEGLEVKGITFSPIKGPKGNIEFLVYFALQPEIKTPANLSCEGIDSLVHTVVENAYRRLL